MSFNQFPVNTPNSANFHSRRNNFEEIKNIINTAFARWPRSRLFLIKPVEGADNWKWQVASPDLISTYKTAKAIWDKWEFDDTTDEQKNWCRANSDFHHETPGARILHNGIWYFITEFNPADDIKPIRNQKY